MILASTPPEIHHFKYNIHHFIYRFHHFVYKTHHFIYKIHHFEYRIHHLKYKIHQLPSRRGERQHDLQTAARLPKTAPKYHSACRHCGREGGLRSVLPPQPGRVGSSRMDDWPEEPTDADWPAREPCESNLRWVTQWRCDIIFKGGIMIFKGGIMIFKRRIMIFI